MKKLNVILIMIMSPYLCLCAENLKEIKAEIRQVTVYPDRAQLTHETVADLPAGNTILKLGGLSPYIDQQSIQVKGAGDFTILSVNHTNNYLENLEGPSGSKKYNSQIEALKLKVEDEKADIAVLKEKEAFLVANRAILVKETTFSIDQLKSVMNLYTTSMDEISSTTLRKNRLIKDYEKQIDALQKQISDKFGKQQLPSGEIEVTVSAPKPVSGKLSFAYVVSNAGWFPSYDIRVDDITNPVSIFYKANVFQNTGVTWKNVKLSFSNATPWISGDVPRLNPWFIDFFVPVMTPKVAGYARNAMKKSQEAAPDMVVLESAIEDENIEAAPVMIEKNVGQTTVSFDVAVPYSIPSDGKVQIIEIQRTKASANYRYAAIPKLSPVAYLTGNIGDWAEQSLIGGEATLYFENTFVGKSYMNVDQLKDSLTISLGTDNSILLKREKRKDFTSKRTIGSNKTDTFSFLISIRNNKQSPVKLSLYDQIPISTNSGIEVESSELSGGKLNSQTGEIHWDLTIKPQEIREVILTYSVKYPKDKTIILE
jgi:uncharacterized protein (TIGR02231 family)